MKAFLYKGEVYLRCIPSKVLFRSTMIHEVVNRGDIFAMNVNTQEFTVIAGKSEVEHIEVSLGMYTKIANQKHVDTPAKPEYTAPSKSQAARLQSIRSALDSPMFLKGDLVRLSWWADGTSAVPIVKTEQDAAGCWRYQLKGIPTMYLEQNLVGA